MPLLPIHTTPPPREAPLRSVRRALSVWIAALVAALFLVALISTPLRAQITLYWDTNGTTAGAGGSSPSGTWSTSGSDKNWSTNSSGTAGDNKWTAGSFAIFSAGTDATGSYTVTVSGTQSVAGITVAEGTPLFSSGTLSLTGATPTISVAASSTATFNSLLASTTGFTKTGTGTMILGNAANAFTGTTTVSAGTLKLSVNGGLSANSALVIASGATVDFDWGHSATIASLAGSGTLDTKGGTLTVGDATNTTFSGLLTDSGAYGGIVKNGTGTLTLSSANAFAGQVNITAGALNLQHSSALGGNTWGNTVGSGAALQFQNNITVTEGSFNLNGAGVGSTGALRNISGANTFNGSVVLASSATIGSDAGTLSVTGDVNLGSSQILSLVGAGNLAFSGAIYGSASGLTQTGTGTTTFSGSSANSFGGTLNIDSGTVQFNKTAGTNATNGGAINIGNGVGAANSATLTLLASNQIPDSSALLTINADGRFNLNNQTETLNLLGGTGTLDLGATGKLSLGVNGGSSVFGGTLAGTGTLEKLGGGTLTFNSNIDFAGTLLLSGGTLALNGYDLTVGTLHITGNTILDFGSSTASLLNATTFVIDAGVTLTLNNWVNGVDYFFATNWTGATPGVRGSAPMNQLTFTGFTANNTGWQSYDNQITPITPVPEPAASGALLIAFAAGLTLWHRKKSRADLRLAVLNARHSAPKTSGVGLL